ncbi:MAG: hypothetical protein K6G56_00130 [Clostridiales bacterium]|nr:hypothetical protein [Clostridiales bacterium]
MNNAKFTLNSALIILIIAAALIFFVMITLFDLANFLPMNLYYRVGDTDLGVRYSSLEGNGLFKGPEKTCKKVLEGNFGYEWGLVLDGNSIYTNEYETTSFQMVLCSVVRIDAETYEKEVLFRDTILRGRCASGEIVCVKDAVMDANFPKTNSLFKLYSIAKPRIDPAGGAATVIFLDPATGEIVWEVKETSALNDKQFKAFYLDKTLEEVKK